MLTVWVNVSSSLVIHLFVGPCIQYCCSVVLHLNPITLLTNQSFNQGNQASVPSVVALIKDYEEHGLQSSVVFWCLCYSETEGNLSITGMLCLDTVPGAQVDLCQVSSVLLHC